MMMGVKHWIALYVEHSDSVMTLWTVYVLVVALVVGFVAQQPGLGAERWLLFVAFPLFALANGIPLFLSQTTLADIHTRLPGETRNMLRVSPPCLVAMVHVVMDMIVVVFLVGWGNWFGPKEDGTSS